jgi:hypothetical protein
VDGRVTRLALGTTAAAMAFLALSACSPEAGFPAVHDMPAPRPEAPLTPDQVQQATDSLISKRNQLNAQTAAPAPAQNAGTSRKNPPPSAAQPKTPPTTQQTDPGPIQAGAYAKP